jgi:hypothetical protein
MVTKTSQQNLTEVHLSEDEGISTRSDTDTDVTDDITDTADCT